MEDPTRPKRHGTVIGERNENRANTPAHSVRLPETMPPPRTRRASTFNFEGPTPPAMDPTTYHALQKIREEMIASDVGIRSDVKEIGAKVGELGEGHAGLVGKVDTLVGFATAEEQRRARAAELRWRHTAGIITAVLAGVAGIIAAIAKLVG